MARLARVREAAARAFPLAVPSEWRQRPWRALGLGESRWRRSAGDVSGGVGHPAGRAASAGAALRVFGSHLRGEKKNGEDKMRRRIRSRLWLVSGRGRGWLAVIVSRWRFVSAGQIYLWRFFLCAHRALLFCAGRSRERKRPPGCVQIFAAP